ncbi:hypothetical protein LY76DRAFT_281825 [Colletotrichum caudatum]|nr:hypothetical protein LY76DRAFT_281825 [Colletotrichum caudatum]
MALYILWSRQADIDNYGVYGNTCTDTHACLYANRTATVLARFFQCLNKIFFSTRPLLSRSSVCCADSFLGEFCVGLPVAKYRSVV